MLPESLAMLRTVAPDKAPGGEGAEAGEGTGQCLPLAASWSLLPPEDKEPLSKGMGTTVEPARS